MTFWQFFSSVVDSLAWPAVAVIVLHAFHRPIIKLIGRVRLVRWKDAHAEFAESLSEAEAEAAELPAPTPNAHQPESIAPPATFQEAEKLSANYGVFLAWLDVERALNEFSRARGLGVPRGGPLLHKLIRRHEWLDAQTIGLLDDLRALRNLAVHPDESRPITSAEAQRYKAMAEQVVQSIQSQTRISSG